MNFLTIIQWNCFKMTQARLVEFKLFLEKLKPDIVSIQEVKLNQEQAYLYLRFDCYVTSYKARERKPDGGGTAILVADSVIHMVIGLDKDHDHVGVRIETNELGDLNAKTKTLGCRSLDKNGRVLEEILSSELDLCVLNDESPTYFRHRNEYSEILDLFICSPRLVSNGFGYEVLNEYLMGRDHALLCVLFDFRNPLDFKNILLN